MSDRMIKWVMCLLSIVLMVLGGVAIFNDPPEPPKEYIGKIVFQSTTEYAAFKNYVGQPEVEINSVAVLSSDPPIVVMFQITVPSDSVSPYGEDVTKQTSRIATYIVGTVLFVIGTGLFIASATGWILR